MSSTLRKHIEVPLPSGEIIGIDVTMRIIEIIERVWDESVDAVISRLSSSASIKRSLVAETVAQWITPAAAPNTSRREIKEAIMRADAEMFGSYAGLVYAAAMYSVRYIEESDFDRAVKGISKALSKAKPVSEEAPAAGDGKSGKGAGRRASRSKRTTS